MSRVLSQLPKQHMLRGGKPQQNFLIFVVFRPQICLRFLALDFKVVCDASRLCFMLGWSGVQHFPEKNTSCYKFC